MIIVSPKNLPKKNCSGQTAQNIIEVGKRLIATKSLVQHGHWQAWLNDNFQLTDRTAQNFMKCAERFGKTEIDFGFSSTQMIALLALPDAEETEKFIAEKAAEGKRVDEMTIKQLRKEIADLHCQNAVADIANHDSRGERNVQG